MNVTKEDIDEYISLIENIQLESKPTLKMRYLGTANHFAIVALSIYYHGLISRCPTPKWNNVEAIPSDVLTAVKTIITKDMYNTKLYYNLPFIVQKVLYYMSNSSNIGLQAQHLHSVLNILPIPDLIALLNVTDIPHQNLCCRCEDEQDLDGVDICSNCLSLLYSTIEYRVGDFELYGVARQDFKIKLAAYHINVHKGKYTFTYTNTTEECPHQGLLPFVEYQDDISVLM